MGMAMATEPDGYLPWYHAFRTTNHQGPCVIDIDIEELQVWARECGDIALRLFNRVKAQRKADNSPVTEQT